VRIKCWLGRHDHIESGPYQLGEHPNKAIWLFQCQHCENNSHFIYDWKGLGVCVDFTENDSIESLRIKALNAANKNNDFA
jgi:hypothetical protein